TVPAGMKKARAASRHWPGRTRSPSQGFTCTSLAFSAFKRRVAMTRSAGASRRASMGVATPFHAKHPRPEQDAAAAAAGAASADERVRRESWFKHLLSRPEFAALAGTVMVFLVFGLAAGNSGMFNLDGVMNWSQVAAY